MTSITPTNPEHDSRYYHQRFAHHILAAVAGWTSFLAALIGLHNALQAHHAVWSAAAFLILGIALICALCSTAEARYYRTRAKEEKQWEERHSSRITLPTL